MGKPYQMTPPVRAKLLECLRKGLSRTAAASTAGIHPSTLRHWVRKGEADDAEEPYLSFYVDYCNALAGFEADMVGHVTEAAPKSWQAAMTLLERRFPAQWSRTFKHEDNRPPAVIEVTFAKPAADDEHGPDCTCDHCSE